MKWRPVEGVDNVKWQSTQYCDWENVPLSIFSMLFCFYAAILASYVIKGVSTDMMSGVGGGYCSESREEEEICIY